MHGAGRVGRGLCAVRRSSQAARCPPVQLHRVHEWQALVPGVLREVGAVQGTAAWVVGCAL